jgi:hypothetical protein
VTRTGLAGVGRGLACLVFAAALSAGCSSRIAVRSDIDPRADFSQYRSWDYFDPMGIEGGYNSPVYGETFREAISGEMKARGYRLSDAPDLKVNVTFQVDEKVKMTTYTQPYMSGYYYNRPGGAYYGSGLGVGVGVGSRASEVTEASVFIDVVDTGRHQLVWQGVATFTVGDKVQQDLARSVQETVSLIFAEYPVQAGRSAR